MNRIKIIAVLSVCSVLLLTNCKKESQKLSTALEESVDSSSKQEKGNTLSLLFNGDASRGSTAVWKAINVEQSGSVSVVTDETGTPVWKFLKPAGSHRAEGHGAKGYQAAEGSDIYIGWTHKLLMPTTLQTNSIFQWKAYPTAGSLANHPIMIRTRNGYLEVEYFDQNHIASVPWKKTLATNTWVKIVLRLKASYSSSTGFIELWYNGVKQTFTNGSQRFNCRTLDSDYCDPKWGVYGGDASSVTNYTKKIRIASTYAEAAQ